MIAPRFYLGQDETQVHVHIFIKYAKVSEVEIEIQENRFWFYLKPYHLKLSLPGKLVSDSPGDLQYDIDKGEIIISVKKLVQGEEFQDLDLISKLLESKKSKKGTFLIEEIGEAVLQNDEFLGTGYGFNRKENSFFANRLEEMHELFDINPDEIPIDQRISASITMENRDWDLDRYFEDLDHEVSNIKFERLYKKFLPSLLERMEDLSLDTLVRLGNRSLLVHPQLVQTMMIQVTDLIFSFCFEMRSMEELTCESASNINKISPTLACLVEFTMISDMIKACFRRILIYSLYRNYLIAERAWADVIGLFREGKAAVVRVLIQLKMQFDKSEPRYLLNRLFVEDFIIWVQKCEEFQDFSNQLTSAHIPSIEELDLNFHIT